MPGRDFAWGAFSLSAALLQLALERAGSITPLKMALASRWLSAAVLIASGMYQFSPVKDRCLRHCRSPAQFLSRYFRPGPVGALRMGLLHGGFCIGCCWLFMALLFVGGVMNLAWIALLTLLVMAEKLLPCGRAIAAIAGLGLIGGGLFIALAMPA